MSKAIDYYKILEALGDGVICVNEDNLVVYINTKAKEILGKYHNYVELEHIIDIFDVISNNEKSIIENIIREVRLHGVFRGLENGAYVITKGNKKAYVSASISRIEFNDSKYVVISFRDITKLRNLEIENTEQKNNLETIFNSMPLGIVIVDEERRVLQTNPFMHHNFKVSHLGEAEILLGELLKCSNAHNKRCGSSESCMECVVRRNIESLMKEEQAYNIIKIKFSHNIGDVDVQRDYQVGFVNIFQNDHRRTLLIIQDITEQVNYEVKIQKAKEEAEEANRLKSEFLSNMSHEIRTPLNGIIGMIDLTKRKVVDPEVIDNLKIAKTSSLNLLQIINSVLDISKIEAGKFVLYEKPFDITKMFSEIYLENKVKVKSHNIQLILEDIQYEKQVFSGDKLRIKQVINNLVDNAIKFTESGEISINSRIEESGNQFLLKVNIIDTGIGIEEDYLDKLFESFTQADGSFTRQKGGTGLGLSISKKIVEKMGGQLSCKSEIGKGSNFSVTIPLKVNKEKNSDINELPYNSGDDKVLNEVKKESKPEIYGRILLVEDDVVNQKIVKRQLELDGHIVETAINGKAAVRAFNMGVDYDLIIMDIQMPVMSGTEATDIIRKTSKGKDATIIALTALALKEDQERIMEHDFDMFISKPVQLFKLSIIVQEILQKRKMKFVTVYSNIDDNIHVYENISIIRKLVKDIQGQLEENNIEELVDLTDKLLECTKDSELEVLRQNAFKMQMDLRKEKTKRVQSLLNDITKDLDCSIIQ